MNKVSYINLLNRLRKTLLEDAKRDDIGSERDDYTLGVIAGTKRAVEYINQEIIEFEPSVSEEPVVDKNYTEILERIKRNIGSRIISSNGSAYENGLIDGREVAYQEIDRAIAEQPKIFPNPDTGSILKRIKEGFKFIAVNSPAVCNSKEEVEGYVAATKECLDTVEQEFSRFGQQPSTDLSPEARFEIALVGAQNKAVSALRALAFQHEGKEVVWLSHAEMAVLRINALLNNNEQSGADGSKD